jgi:glycopeptide antibiotics resistance protein
MLIRFGPPGNVISAMPIWVSLWLILLVVAWWRGASKGYLIFLSLFCLYFGIMIDLISFPIQINPETVEQRRALGPIIRYNLNPLYFGHQPNAYTWLITVLNLLITVPFGFALPWVLPIGRKTMLWIAALTGPVFEGIQLLEVSLGYANRVIDMQDVILNSLGVLLGYSLLLLGSSVYLWLVRKGFWQGKTDFYQSVRLVTHRSLG